MFGELGKGKTPSTDEVERGELKSALERLSQEVRMLREELSARG